MEHHLANSCIPLYMRHVLATFLQMRDDTRRVVGMLIRFVVRLHASGRIFLLINMQGQFSINLNLNFIIYL